MGVRWAFRHVVLAVVAGSVWLGCDRPQGDLTAPHHQPATFSMVDQSGRQFVSVDYPGATYTSAQSISPTGEVLGRYGGDDGFEHGFLLVRGAITAVPPVPGAFLSAPNRVNSRGVIVGTYDDDVGEHGYVLAGGSFRTIDFPDNSEVTAWGISSNGTIVGLEDPARDFIHAHGYALRNGDTTLIDFPAAVGTFPTAISDNGNIVGSYLTSDFFTTGFLWSGGKFTRVHVPNSTYD
ncbi:MAG TPA: hypothetical protein VG454_17305, partial [Gemmatimonadales bacterium]|nr:hypothetical protein [Gemmatimonadales bacterium]